VAARRISLVNFKGGVGKTSLTVNLAACLAHDLNQKVLVVDMDAQSNTSIWLMGIPRWNILNGSPEKSTWGIFQKDFPGLNQVLVREVFLNEHKVELIPNLDLIASTYRLMDLEHEYQDVDRTPYYARFRAQLEILFDQYDYILFDCPPNVFRATKCALFCSEEIYVPANPDLLSYVGLSLLAEKVSKFQNESTLQRQIFPGAKNAVIRGIILNSVATNADYRDILARMEEKIISLRPKQVVSDDADILPVRIRRTVNAAKPQSDALPATLDRESGTALKEDYLNLARYIHNTPLSKKGQPYGRKNK
jgi:chromosome partitioning protein